MAAPTVTAPEAPQLLSLPITLVHESETNYRRRHDEQAHAELVESVRKLGILTPLIVRKRETHPGYEVAAGHRRLRAAIAADLDAVPAIVREMDDREFAEVMLTENLQRVDPDPLDEADGYQALIDRLGYDVATLAARFGKSVTYIRQRLQLQHAGAQTRRALQLDMIELGHAVLLARVDEAEQDRLLRETLRVTYRLRAAELEQKNDADEDDGFDDDVDGGAKDVSTDSHRTACSVAALRRIMAGRFLPLAPTPWAKDDATLVPAAGACTTCSKRTGSAPGLFEEFDASDDRCADQACYGAKKAAWLEARVTACRAQAPSMVVISAAKYGRPKLKTFAGQPVLVHGIGYRDAEKRDKRRTPAIIVDAGPMEFDDFEQLGELVDVVLLDPVKEKAKQAAKKAREQAAQSSGGGNLRTLTWDERNKAKRDARVRFVTGAGAVVRAMVASEHSTSKVHPMIRVALLAVMGATTPPIAVEVVREGCDFTWEFEELEQLFADSSFEPHPWAVRIACEVALIEEWGPVIDDAYDQLTIDEATKAYPLPAALVDIAAAYHVDAPTVFAAALQPPDAEA